MALDILALANVLGFLDFLPWYTWVLLGVVVVLVIVAKVYNNRMMR